MKTITVIALIIWASCWRPVSAQDIFEQERGLYSTGELRLSDPLGVKRKLLIQSAETLHGSLIIVADSSADIAVIYQKRARAQDQETAVDFIDLIDVDIEQIGGKTRLRLRAPNPAPWDSEDESGLVEARIICPIGCAIEIEARFFDVDATGPFRSLTAEGSLGRMDISRITEELSISTSNRRVRVRDISGKVAVATTNSTLIVENVASSGRRAELRNQGGDISIDGFSGELSVKNSYGRIDAERLTLSGGRNSIRSTWGPITLDIEHIDAGRLLITNRYEDIELNLPEDISALLSLAVEESGKIEVSNLKTRPELVESNRMTLIARDGRIRIQSAITGSGNIYIRGEDKGE